MGRSAGLGLGVLIACALALGAGERTASTAAGDDGPRPLKVAYVDLTRLFKGYHRREGLEADLKTLRTSLTEKDRAGVAEIERYKRRIEQLALGTQERLDLEKEAQAAAQRLDKARRASVAELSKRVTATLDELYEDVLAEVAAVGREGGYDFILKDQSRERKGATADQMVRQISQRSVLYAKPELDLTDRVLKRLNKRHAARKKGDEAKKAAKPTAGAGEER